MMDTNLASIWLLRAMSGIVTSYDPKPIPIRTHDWSAVTADHDDGHPIGYGATEAAAIADLMSEIEDRMEG